MQGASSNNAVMSRKAPKPKSKANMKSRSKHLSDTLFVELGRRHMESLLGAQPLERQPRACTFILSIAFAIHRDPAASYANDESPDSETT